MADGSVNLASALAKAQGEMKAAAFDRVNPHFKSKYASLASVIDTIREAMARNGLAYTQVTQIRDGQLILLTTLHHISGETLQSEYPLPSVAKPQELGSALTYARRYSLSALVCIAADEDDDAEGARNGGQIASLPKKDAKDIYARLQRELDALKDASAMRTWAIKNKERIDILPSDWRDILRMRYQEQMAMIENAAPEIGSSDWLAKIDADMGKLANQSALENYWNTSIVGAPNEAQADALMIFERHQERLKAAG